MRAAGPPFVLAEGEEVAGRPCRSFAPGARGLRRPSLDGRSRTNTGTLPTDSEIGRQNEARSEGRSTHSPWMPL